MKGKTSYDFLPEEGNEKPLSVSPSPHHQQQRLSPSSSPHARSPVSRIVHARRYWSPLDDGGHDGAGNPHNNNEQPQIFPHAKSNDSLVFTATSGGMSAEVEDEFQTFVEHDRNPRTTALEQHRAAIVIQREVRNFLARKGWMIWAVESAVAAASAGTDNAVMMIKRSSDTSDGTGMVLQTAGRNEYNAASYAVDDDDSDDDDPVAWIVAEFSSSGEHSTTNSMKHDLERPTNYTKTVAETPVLNTINDVTNDTSDDDSTFHWPARDSDDGYSEPRGRPRNYKLIFVVLTALLMLAAAVAIGILVNGGTDRDGIDRSEAPPPLPLTCPGVSDPDISTGFASIDILVNRTFLVPEEAEALGNTFEGAYNDFFGCDSEYSRVALSCSVPCSSNNGATINTEEQRCCQRQEIPGFGEALRCNVECTVHCDGCYKGEPLFWTNITAGASSEVSSNNSVSAMETDGADNRRLNIFAASVDGHQHESNRVCSSPVCQFMDTLGSQVCAGLVDQSEAACSVIGITTTDVITGETAESVFDTDPPTTNQPSSAAPSQLPTQVPSPVPTEKPPSLSSRNPTTSPTLNPTNEPSSAPTDKPTMIPTLRPSPRPTRSPTLGPTTGAPSSSPSELVIATNAPTSHPTNSITSNRPSEMPKTRQPTRRPTPRPSVGASTKAPTRRPTLVEGISDDNDGVDGDLVFYLINAEYDFTIRRLKPGDVIDLSRDGRFLSIEAVPTGLEYSTDRVGSIVFTLDRQIYAVENGSPYALGADADWVEYRAVPELTNVGTHQLVATVYTRANARGRILSTTVLSFQVRDYR